MDTEETKKLFEDDLASLLDLTFTDGQPKIRELRLASTILRRWLCDNELGQLTRELNIKAEVPAIDDTKIYRLLKNDADIQFYISLGIKFNSNPWPFAYYSASDSPPTWLKRASSLSECLFRPSKLLRKPVLFFKGNFFRYDEIIRFTCNKLGGAHHDLTRNTKNMMLEEACNFMTFGGPFNLLEQEPRSEIHIVSEPNSKEAHNAAFAAIVSAATSLVNIRFNNEPFIDFSTLK